MIEVKEKPDKKSPIVKNSKKKSKITSGNIERYQQKIYLENIQQLVEVGYQQLIKAMRRGDMKALGMGLEIANLYKPKTGQVNIVNQIYNKNGSDPSQERAQSFESILRRLEAKDAAVKASETIIEVK